MDYSFDSKISLLDIILNNTSDYIIIVDSNMKIKKFSLSAQTFFGVTEKDIINAFLSDFINISDFKYVIENKQNIANKKVKYDNLNIVTIQNIIYLEYENMAVGIIKNITFEEKENSAIYKKRIEAIEMAQNVIDKQMTAAQQIASLLGETTAETKITLNKLKNLIDNKY